MLRDRVLKHSLCADLMQDLVNFSLNGGLHAVSVRKPSEQISNL